MTNTTTLTNTIKTFYDRMLLEALDPMLVFYQFGIKKPLPTGEGMSVYWNLPRRLALGYALSQGSPVLLSAGYALSTTRVSAIINQYGGFTDWSDLVGLTSITDVGEMASQRLGAQAGETIERVIVNAIQHHVSASGFNGHHIFKTSAEVTDYWGMTSTVSAGIMTVSSTNVIAVSDIRNARSKLKALNVPAYEGNDYIAIVNTETANYILGDSTFINFHQYVDKGVDNLYNGEIGRVYGVRFVETTQGPAKRGSNAGGTSSTIAYGTVIFGKGFYGVTELDGGIKTYISEGASKADPLNQTTVYGWKSSFTSKVLNTSAGLILWTGAGETTAAYAESASSGLRQEDPTSY
jgi:N4-gp56 family major capsid protein